MMTNCNMTIWWFFYGGVPTAFLARYGLAPFFRTMGIFTGNKTLTSIGNWFASTAGTFILGACLICADRRVRARHQTYFRIQNILILIAIISTVLSVAVFVGKIPADAIQPSMTSSVRSQARPIPPPMRALRPGAGYTGLEPFSLIWTLLVMTWIYLNLSFMSSSAYIGTEVKNARHLQLWSMPVTLLVVGSGCSSL